MSALDRNFRSGRVLVSVPNAAPLEGGWRAVRHPEQLQSWFGWGADTLKDEIAFIFAAHADEARHIIAMRARSTSSINCVRRGISSTIRL